MINHDVSDKPHLEVDLGPPGGHTQAQHRCVKSSITFPENEELVLCEVWEFHEETLKGSVVIVCDLKQEQVIWFLAKFSQMLVRNYLKKKTYLVIIGFILLVIRVGVTHSCGRLQVQHVGDFIPA